MLGIEANGSKIADGRKKECQHVTGFFRLKRFIVIACHDDEV
jgi:hypothetical protein